jgi:hypothetical protein
MKIFPAALIGATFATIAVGIVPASGQQRRLRVPVTSTVRYRPAETPLTTADRITLLGQMTGAAQNAAALAEPVRLSVRHPDQPGRIFMDAIYVSSYPGGLGDEVWDLDKGAAFLKLFIMAGVITKPVLVDCLVQGRPLPSTTYPMWVTFSQRGASEKVAITAEVGHAITMMAPAGPNEPQALLTVSRQSPDYELFVYYCEVTATQ